MRVITGSLQDASGDPLAGKTVALHSGQRRFLKGRAVTDRDGKFQVRVRDWDFSRRFFSNRAYWVIILRDAEGTSPPTFTRLTALIDDPDAMLLERP